MLLSIEEQDRDCILTQEGKNCMSVGNANRRCGCAPKATFIYSLAQPSVAEREWGQRELGLAIRHIEKEA